MASLTSLTWNFCGIGSQAKRIEVVNRLHNLQADICLLQESHLSDSDYTRTKSAQFTHLFLAHCNTTQRGVWILVNMKISFIHNTTITDQEGHFIIINISINNTSITIANVYDPNTDDSAFFQNCFASLSNLFDCPIIIAGYFNCFSLLNLHHNFLYYI